MSDTNDLKLIVAKNITELRKQNGYTQIQLAEKLNYTDKAISKWERGESIPDVAVLKKIAELFNVGIDYIVEAEHSNVITKNQNISKRRRKNYAIITGMSIVLAWLVATLIFVIFELVSKGAKYHWLSFVYAVPVSMVIWLVFNSVWFNRRRNFLIITLLMWTCLCSLYISLLPFGINIWLVFILGIPGQVIIALWSNIKLKSKE